MLRDNVFTNTFINSFMSQPAGAGRRRKHVKNGWVRVDLLRLKELIKIQGLNIKPRDIAKIIGEYNHAKATRFGMLLALLEEAGLAKSWNKSKPIHYTLQPAWLWQKFSEVCSFQCLAGDSSCPLFGVCPYHQLLQLLAEKEREVSE